MDAPQPAIQDLFVTRIYRADAMAPAQLNGDIEALAMTLAQDDAAGLKWCETHGYPGYTSFASLNDLPWRFAKFARLVKLIDRHCLAYAKSLHWDLRGMRPVCDSLWVNVMPEGGSHTSHLHPNSVISGTYYVTVPEGAGPVVVPAGVSTSVPNRPAQARGRILGLRTRERRCVLSSD